MREFTPWTIDGDRVILGSGWEEPKRWEMEYSRCSCQRELGDDGPLCGYCEAARMSNPSRPRVLVTTDFAAPCDGPVVNTKGKLLWRDVYGQIISYENPLRGRAVVLADLRADIFRLIDATPNLDWWLVTQHPERVEDAWQDRHCYRCGNTEDIRDDSSPDGRRDCEVCAADRSDGVWDRRDNVTLAALVRTQSEADRLIPALLDLRDLSPCLWLLVEPRERIDLNASWLVPWEQSDGPCGPDIWNGLYVCDSGHAASRYLKSEQRGGNFCLAARCDARVYPAKPGVARVIIRGAIDGTPTNIDHVRNLKRQCEMAGVLCEMWPEDLRDES